MKEQKRMSVSFIENFCESPVEMTVGIVTLLGGLALTSQDNWPRLVGAALTAMASYLISWTMAATKARADARFELQNRMTQVGTHLATTSSRIVEAIRAGETGESEPVTAFARVRDGAAGLFGLVQQIEEESGKAISSSAVIQNAERIMALSTRLRYILADDSVDAEELHEVQTELEAVAGELNEHPVAHPAVNANCPKCNESARFVLGESKGDSAMPTCEKCGSRFHAHRQFDGGIETRIPGSSSSSRQFVALREIAVNCPMCQNRIPLRVARHEESLKFRFCMNCLTRLEIDPVESTVVRHQQGISEVSKVAGKQNEKYLLYCSNCDRDIASFYQNNDDVFAVCYRCDPPKLLQASIARFKISTLNVKEIFHEVDRLKLLSREAAVSYLKDCIEVRSPSSELYQVLGAALRKWAVEFREDRNDEIRAKKYLKEAIVAHEQALKLLNGKENSKAASSIYYAKGRAHLEAKENKKAEACARKTLNIDDKHEGARAILAQFSSDDGGQRAASFTKTPQR